MEPVPKTFEARSARQTLAMMFETWESFFPPGQRNRYEQVAAAFETRDQMHWLERARARTPQVADALRALGEWNDIPDSELLVSSWDDEVLFFYVLRTQYIVAWMAAKPDAMVPGHLDEFWQWAMTLRADEPWILFPVLTTDAIRGASVKPPIWKIPYPCDYPKAAA